MLLTNKLVLEKKLLADNHLEEIKENLTGRNPAYSSYKKLLELRPYLKYSKKYPEPPKEIILYEETDTYISIPRGLYQYLLDLGYVITDNTSSPTAEFEPLFVLRDYQKEAIKKVTSSRYGILEAPTGSGKTMMALAIAALLGQKTLFIVHTKTLLDQTVGSIKKNLGIDAGIIGNGKFKILDFTVATVQTLLKRDLSKYVNEFGLVFFDEAHHVPSRTFTEVAEKFNARYVYGLSATISRPDGLSWAMHASIGPLLHTVDRDDLLSKKAIVKPKIIAIPTPFIPQRTYDDFDVANHLNEISQSDLRNEFIVSYIKKVFAMVPTIKPVILTDRVAHVEHLAKELYSFRPIVYHGKLNPKEQNLRLERIKNSSGAFTIATYSSIGEGFDVPLWDTLFLATPFSSSIRLVQVLGRISRPAPNKTNCYVHDFVDEKDSILLSRYKKRKKAYDTLI